MEYNFFSKTYKVKSINNAKLSLLLLLFSISQISAQDPVVVDSLQIELSNAREDTFRIRQYKALYNYYARFNNQIALEYAVKANDLALKISDEYWGANTFIDLGGIYISLGQYENSIESYLNALRLVESKPEKYAKEHFRIYNNTGAIYDRLEDYDNALEYYFKCLKLFSDYPELASVKDFNFIVHNNIGNIYNSKNEPEKALSYYQKALEEAKLKRDDGSLGIAYNNLGKLYFQRFNDFEQARKYLFLSEKHRIMVNNNFGLSKTYYFLSFFYLEKNELDSAQHYAELSLEYAKATGHLVSEVYATLFLSEVYEKQGRHIPALKQYKSYKYLYDSLINIQKIRELNDSKSRFEIEKVEEQIKHEKQLSRIRMLFLTAIVILLIIVIILLYISYHNKRRRIEVEKEKLTETLELKNQELASNVMYMVSKNEFINNAARKLLDLKEQVSETNKKPMQRIILELQTEVDKNVWTEFDQRFQQVHTEFYKNLLEKHPDLTPSESRLVAFLRLNMTSKEIAAITHHNIKAIEVARSRLRKKLNLTGTDVNLIAYLNSL